jgi:hypothetical protein
MGQKNGRKYVLILVPTAKFANDLPGPVRSECAASSRMLLVGNPGRSSSGCVDVCSPVFSFNLAVDDDVPAIPGAAWTQHVTPLHPIRRAQSGGASNALVMVAANAKVFLEIVINLPHHNDRLFVFLAKCMSVQMGCNPSTTDFNDR